MGTRVEYDSTLDEIAELHLRAYRRSKIMSRTRWQSSFWALAVVAPLVLLMMLTIAGASLWESAAAAVLSGVVAGVVNWFYFPQSLRRRTLRLLRERLKSEGPFHFVFELRDDCVWMRQGGTEISFAWANVAEIVDEGDAVEFRMRDGGWMFVRERGLPTPQSRAEFVETARRKMLARRRQDG